MIRTFKIKHQLSLDPSLFKKAQQIANYALEHKKEKNLSSKHVKHFGLHSKISCQIIRKYAKNKKIKKIKLERVKLILPGQVIKFDKLAKTITIVPLKSKIDGTYLPLDEITKLNQIELDKTYAYISVTLPDVEQQTSENYIGIDLNSTSHSIVVASPSTKKILMLGSQIPHLKKKYKNIRKRLQSQKRFRELKQVNRREHFKTLDIIRKCQRRLF